MAGFNRNQLRDDRVGDAIGKLVLVREITEGAFRDAQFALEEAERTIESQRRKLIESDLRWYTEAQLANRMMVSTETLARMRRAKKIPHSSPNARTVRYTSEDELEIARILQRPARPDAGMHALRRTA